MKHNSTTLPCSSRPRIELLEPRIAPAGVLKLIDIDGDLITIHSSTGTNAQLDSAVHTIGVAGAHPDSVLITAMAFTDPVFEGSSITVTAKRGPAGGDGSVNVDSFNSTGRHLASVTIDGSLGLLSAGDGSGYAIGKLSASGTHGGYVCTINGSVKIFTIRGDMVDTETHIQNGNLDVLKVGGSIRTSGTVGDRYGYLSVDTGRLGKAVIGGSIEGGPGEDGGVLYAKTLGTLTVVGSLLGGAGVGSGRIEIGGAGTSITILGNVVGHTGDESGKIYVASDLAAFSLGGSVIGGPAQYGTDPNQRGQVKVDGLVGKFSIHGSIIGSTGDRSAQVSMDGAKVVTIGGSVVGGTGLRAGRLFFSTTGANSVTVGGSLVGGVGNDSGQLYSDGPLGSVRIGGEVHVGNATLPGTISSPERIGSIFIGGSITMMPGASLNAAITGGRTIGTITVNGGIYGSSASTPVGIYAMGIPNSDLEADSAIRKLSVRRSVIDANILAGYTGSAIPMNGDVHVGTVSIGGDWIRSNLSAGVSAGGDGRFGTADDAGPIDGDHIDSTIARIVINGSILGSTIPGAFSGFVAQHLGSFKIAGSSVALTPGPANDLTITHDRTFGPTFNVTLHEVFAG